ncbi:MAG: ABC transporter permease [Salinivirgaceae bacterium]|jgi:ABC-2 type transport system permease protein|nr:ABC transporter permease [Salinivirgaceae bacterium]
MSTIKNTILEILSICIDELRNIFKDGGVMLLLFGATLIYPLIYSLAYHPEVLRDAPIAVIDNNNSQISRELTRMIDASAEVNVDYKPTSLLEAKQLFYKGDIAGIVAIPENFLKNISSGKQAYLSVYADASYMMLYKQVYTASATATITLGKKIEIKKRMMQGTPKEAAIKQSSPINFEARGLFNPIGGYSTYAMPAILVLILQQTLLLGIGMRGGTARELGARHFLLPKMASGEGGLRIIFGKTLAYSILYIPISFYLFVVVFSWFDFPMAGKLSHLFMLMIPLILSSIMLGLVFTTLFRNRENSMIFLLFTSVPLIFLSGFSWPVESFPIGFQFLANLFPSTPGIIGVLKISIMGGSWQTAMPQITQLWLMAIVFFIINWIIVRVKMKAANSHLS